MSIYTDLILSESGLVGLWTLSDTSGTTAVDLKNGRDGTYTGGFTLNQTGLLVSDASPCTLFNGSTGYVDIPDHNDYSLLTTNQLSVEAWEHGILTDWHTVVAKMAHSGGSNYEWEITRFYNTQVDYKMGTSGNGGGAAGAADLTSVYGSQFPAGIHHVVMTLDYNATTLKLYVDGALIGTNTSWVNLGSLINGNSDVTIGQRGDNNAYNDSTIQNVAIYNTVLTGTQITNHYNYGIGVFPAGGDPMGMMGFFGG